MLSDKLNEIVVDYPNAELFLAGYTNSRIEDYLHYIPDNNIQYIYSRFS